jgi:hypothetical protein
MILRYEKEVHIAQHDETVPGGGNDDFVLLTLARIHKELTGAIKEVHEMNGTKMRRMEDALVNISEKVGAPLPEPSSASVPPSLSSVIPPSLSSVMGIPSAKPQGSPGGATSATIGDVGAHKVMV